MIGDTIGQVGAVVNTHVEQLPVQFGQLRMRAGDGLHRSPAGLAGETRSELEPLLGTRPAEEFDPDALGLGVRVVHGSLYSTVMPAVRVEQHGEDVLLHIKAVPGASRDQVAGVVGDRLKVRISAPPEGGKANKAICRLLAKALGMKAKDVTIVSGQTSPEKVIRIAGARADQVVEKLG